MSVMELNNVKVLRIHYITMKNMIGGELISALTGDHLTKSIQNIFINKIFCLSIRNYLNQYIFL